MSFKTFDKSTFIVWRIFKNFYFLRKINLKVKNLINLFNCSFKKCILNVQMNSNILQLLNQTNKIVRIVIVGRKIAYTNNNYQSCKVIK